VWPRSSARTATPDLFFCDKPESGTAAGVLTFRNEGGAYREVTHTTAYHDLRPQHIDFVDLNFDRRPDLIIVTWTKVSVWLNVGDQFPAESFSFPIREGGHFTVCDIDNDPRHTQDIFVVDGKNRNVATQ
jgi:hypothetical protein